MPPRSRAAQRTKLQSVTLLLHQHRLCFVRHRYTKEILRSTSLYVAKNQGCFSQCTTVVYVYRKRYRNKAICVLDVTIIFNSCCRIGFRFLQQGVFINLCDHARYNSVRVPNRRKPDEDECTTGNGVCTGGWSAGDSFRFTFNTIMLKLMDRSMKKDHCWWTSRGGVGSSTST